MSHSRPSAETVRSTVSADADIIEKEIAEVEELLGELRRQQESTLSLLAVANDDRSPRLRSVRGEGESVRAVSQYCSDVAQHRIDRAEAILDMLKEQREILREVVVDD